jgi:hypothetical protein
MARSSRSAEKLGSERHGAINRAKCTTWAKSLEARMAEMALAGPAIMLCWPEGAGRCCGPSPTLDALERLRGLARGLARQRVGPKTGGCQVRRAR